MAAKASKPANESAYLVAVRDAISNGGDVSVLSQLLKAAPINAVELIELVRQVADASNRERQRATANKKHAQTKKAMDFVREFWQAKRVKYLHNIRFAEAASELVRKKFGVEVKPSTIARDWLRGVEPSRSLSAKKGARAYVDGLYIPGKLKHKSSK